jgi:WD40 repeat protein
MGVSCSSVVNLEESSFVSNVSDFLDTESLSVDRPDDDLYRSNLHTGPVQDVVYVPALNSVYSCGYDKSILCIPVSHLSFTSADGIDGINDSTETVNMSRIDSSHMQAVNKIRGNSHFLYSVSRDMCIKQWDVESLKQTNIIEDAHDLNITALTLYDDELNSIHDKLYTGSRDYSVKCWDITTQTCISKYSSARNVVTDMQFLGGTNHTLVQSSEDLSLRVWDIRSSSNLGNPAIHIKKYTYFPLCIDVNNNGYHVASGCKGFNSNGCDVVIWDLRNSKEPITVCKKGHSQDVTCCKYLHGENVISCSKDGTYIVWDKDSVHKRYQDESMYTSLTILDNFSSRQSVLLGTFEGNIQIKQI